MAIMRRIAATLDITLDLTARWKGGEVDRMLSRSHSLLHESFARHLRAAGWLDLPARGLVLDLWRAWRHRHARVARGPGDGARGRVQDGAGGRERPRRLDGPTPAAGDQDRGRLRLAAASPCPPSSCSPAGAPTAVVSPIIGPSCERRSRSTDATCRPGSATLARRSRSWRCGRTCSRRPAGPRSARLAGQLQASDRYAARGTEGAGHRAEAGLLAVHAGRRPGRCARRTRVTPRS